MLSTWTKAFLSVTWVFVYWIGQNNSSSLINLLVIHSKLYLIWLYPSDDQKNYSTGLAKFKDAWKWPSKSCTTLQKIQDIVWLLPGILRTEDNFPTSGIEDWRILQFEIGYNLKFCVSNWRENTSFSLEINQSLILRYL